MKSILKFTALSLGFILVLSAGSSRRAKPINLAFYNLENLFDTIDHPDYADEEFTPNSDLKWNTEKYMHKQSQLRLVLNALFENGGPDALGLCELENRQVLEDLFAGKYIGGKQWQICHEESQDRRGIDVALALSTEWQVMQQFSDQIALADTGSRTRPIFWVKAIRKKEKPVWFAVCHFPSRRGGEDASAPNRAQAAITLKNRTDSILQTEPDAAIVIMGDFNDEPTDSSMFQVLGAKAPGTKNQALFNLMLPLKEAGKGSYLYRGNWNMLDQIIVSKAFCKKQCPQASILDADFLKEKEGKFAGSPLRTYAGKNYLGGYSDHLPVKVTLKR